MYLVRGVQASLYSIFYFVYDSIYTIHTKPLFPIWDLNNVFILYKQKLNAYI